MAAFIEDSWWAFGLSSGSDRPVADAANFEKQTFNTVFEPVPLNIPLTGSRCLRIGEMEAAANDASFPFFLEVCLVSCLSKMASGECRQN